MKKETLKIGHFSDPIAQDVAHRLAKQLETMNNSATVGTISEVARQQHDGISEILGSGTCDILVTEMRSIPLGRKNGYSIAGVAERVDPAYHLIFLDQSHAYVATSAIGYHATHEHRLIQHLLPDARLKAFDSEERMLAALQEGEVEFLLDAKISNPRFDDPEYSVKRLHPREFIPPPAHGLYAFIIRDDAKYLRKLLHKASSLENGRIAIVERTLQKLAIEKNYDLLGAYAETDDSGHFLAFAALVDSSGSVNRAKLSQSTYVGLAEAIFQSIN